MGKNRKEKKKKKKYKMIENHGKSKVNQNNNSPNKNNDEEPKKNNDDYEETKIFELLYDDTSEYKRIALGCRENINYNLQFKYPQYEMIRQTPPYNEDYYTLYHLFYENWEKIRRNFNI